MWCVQPPGAVWRAWRRKSTSVPQRRTEQHKCLQNSPANASSLTSSSIAKLERELHFVLVHSILTYKVSREKQFVGGKKGARFKMPY